MTQLLALAVIGGALFLIVRVARTKSGERPVRIRGRTILIAIAVIVVAGYGVLSLVQKSNCEQQGGSFSFALPNVCKYPAGSSYAPTSTDQTTTDTTQQSADTAASAVNQDVSTLTSDTSEAQSDWSTVQSDMALLRSNEPSILKDAADAKADHCNTFPSAADTTDVGAGYLLKTLDRVQGDVTQLQTDEASYTQLAQTTPATSPPDSGAVSSAIASANSTVRDLTAKVQAAQSSANQIVNLEKTSISAAGC